ncbi:MAG TPA: hypothetical protein DEA22_04940 [Blastocatellia bacterium]|nr:hypothetical protein [Blastocatellia bacterium]
MFCTKCGTENSEGSAFCRKCGNALANELDSAAPVRSDAEPADSLVLFSINPTRKFAFAGYFAAVVAAFLFVALFSVLLPGISVWIGVIAGMAMLLIPAFYHLRQRLVRYTLTDSTIEIDRGLISRTTQNIPLRRIQDVTVSATITQRILGLGDIVIDNASEDGGKIVLRNIDSAKKYASALLDQMRRIEN